VAQIGADGKDKSQRNQDTGSQARPSTGQLSTDSDGNEAKSMEVTFARTAFGFPRRDASVVRASGIWGIWMPGFCQFVTGVYLFVALTWLESLKQPILYPAAIAFSAYGIHWFAIGWTRYQGNDARANGLMSIAFTIISLLGVVVFFSAGAWPVGIVFAGLTAVYIFEFFASFRIGARTSPPSSLNTVATGENRGSKVSVGAAAMPTLSNPAERALGFARIATGL
jgi:hypothetical protein